MLVVETNMGGQAACDTGFWGTNVPFLDEAC